MQILIVVYCMVNRDWRTTTVDLPDPAQVEFQYDGRGFEDGVMVRADLAVQMTDLANDFTFVEPTACHITKLVKPH
jgi:hypothetical protein